MATHHELGKRGEEIARNYLEQKGYLIREVNWRFRHTEIDLIALHQGILVFAEVKSRSPGGYGFPEDSVGPRKQQSLQRASTAYINLNNYEGEIRFDIISITFHDDGSHELFHIEDAFFPGL